MPLRRRIERDDYVIHVFDKVRIRAENCLEFDNGDFIVATGTPIYRKQLGNSALRRLYDNFDPERLDFQHFYGHYGVLVCKKGTLYAFNDYSGVYCMYRNGDSSLISNSFLAVLASLDDWQFDRQAVYEYLTFESTFGDQSIVRQVSKLSGNEIHQLGLGNRTFSKKITLPEFDGNQGIDGLLADTKDLLLDYFDTLADIFGNRQSIGLTGGYDSRLTLACMRSVDVTPRVYVQGPKESADVQVASAIARGEGFELDYREDEANPQFDPGEFPERVKTALSFLDGLPQSGLFSDFALTAREQRSLERSEYVRLYAIGGEAYRDFWHIPERDYNIEDVFRAKFAKLDSSKFSAGFDKDMYFNSMIAKCKQNLGIDRDRFSWEEVELANAKWLLASWVDGFMTNQNDRAYALIPFAEPAILYSSAKVPMKYKYHGRFEAALISTIDPALASYRSAYGYAFDRRPGLISRCLEKLKTGMPFKLRPLARRSLARFKKVPPLPFYLTDEFVSALVPNGLERMSEFVKTTALDQQRLLSRSLTLELLASNDLAHGFGDAIDTPSEREIAA